MYILYCIIDNNPNRHGNNKDLNVVAPTVTYGIKIMHDVLVLKFLTMLTTWNQRCWLKTSVIIQFFPPSLGTILHHVPIESYRIHCTKSQLIRKKSKPAEAPFFPRPKSQRCVFHWHSPRCHWMPRLEINVNLEDLGRRPWEGAYHFGHIVIKGTSLHKPSLIIIDHHLTII